MNLFILDRQPVLAAQQNNDFHVRKIILEGVQMMGYAYDHGQFKPLPWLFTTRGGLRHLNHPMSLWVRRSKQNFDWTLQHVQALSNEYTYRQKNHKIHAYQSHIDWIKSNIPLSNLSDIGLTDWPRPFGPWKEIIPVTDDVVNDFRKYYCIGKRHLAKWTKRPIPDWYH